jgi:hypothetical protein
MNMKSNMAKQDTLAEISYGEFTTEERFLRFVATHYGSDVSASCKSRLESEAKSKKTKIDAFAVLDVILTQSQQVDFSKAGFRARFSW